MTTLSMMDDIFTPLSKTIENAISAKSSQERNKTVTEMQNKIQQTCRSSHPERKLPEVVLFRPNDNSFRYYDSLEMKADVHKFENEKGRATHAHDEKKHSKQQIQTLKRTLYLKSIVFMSVIILIVFFFLVLVYILFFQS